MRGWNDCLCYEAPGLSVGIAVSWRGPGLKTNTREARGLFGTERRPFLAFLLLSLLISIAATFVFNRADARRSVFTLSNFVGPTAETLLHGEGLTVCSTGLGTLGNPICFHAGRMPLPSAVVALGARLLGDRFFAVALFKMLLLLLPLELAGWLVCRTLQAESKRLWLAVALLLLPFAMTPFLADVVNLQVEEGYSYSLLALATALVLFRPVGAAGWRRVGAFAVTAAMLYLAKSSMAPAVAVLTLAFLWPLRRHAGMVAATLAVVMAAAGGWAMWQHHAAGRYTFGTSIDGVNLHKGNNEFFLARYPPARGDTLDRYDPAMNRGLFFPDEWSFNDYHQRAAVRFITTHPQATAEGAWRKLEVVLFSLRKLGSKTSARGMEAIETGGIVLFRLMFWSALLAAAWAVFRRPGEGTREAGAVFLLLVGAVALPYVVGFAYTRHISVLIYPSALLLCRTLVRPADLQRLP